MEYSKSLSWNELADIYHQKTGMQARTKPMNSVFEWAEKQTDFFMYILKMKHCI